MALLWTDGTWTSESLVGGYRFSYPIDGVTSAIVAEADYVVQASQYTVPTLGDSVSINIKEGTATSKTFYLVGEGPQSDLGGGMVRWTRKWATKPSSHDEYESYSYNFIGFYGAWGVNVTTVSGRDRFTRTVNSRIDNDYYLIHASGDYATEAAMVAAVSVEEQKYVINGTDYEIDYLGDNPPFATASDPTRTAYDGWISAGTEVVAAPSEFERWMGPIWRRKVRYVVAL